MKKWIGVVMLCVGMAGGAQAGFADPCPPAWCDHGFTPLRFEGWWCDEALSCDRQRRV